MKLVEKADLDWAIEKMKEPVIEILIKAGFIFLGILSAGLVISGVGFGLMGWTLLGSPWWAFLTAPIGFGVTAIVVATWDYFMKVR